MSLRQTSQTPKKKRRLSRRTPYLRLPRREPDLSNLSPEAEPELDEPETDWPAIAAHAVRSFVLQAVLKDTLPQKVLNELRQLRPITVLITTPTAEWATALSVRALEVFPGCRAISATRAPSKAFTSDRLEPSATNLAFTPNSGWLSPTVVAGADYKIRLKVRPGVIARAISIYCGQRIFPVTAADVAGLDLADILFAIRSRSTPRECVERLRRAVSSRATAPSIKVVPKLGELKGFGAAADIVGRIARDFERQRDSGAPFSMPGVLLYGPPGTGKTTLAQSFARSVNAPFVSSSVAQWFRDGDGHLGDVALAAQRFFDRAAALAPSVALLDEIDAIPDRAAMDGRDRSFWTPILTGLLTQLDELRRSGLGVALFAATNHFDRLDRALVRPGRLELHVEIKGPQTAAEVEDVFRSCLGKDLSEQSILPAVRLAGLPTGAAIDAWVRLARDCAAREERRLVLSDLVEAIAPAEDRPAWELEEVALHEAAHAVVGYWLGINIESATLISEGRRAGSTQIGPEAAIFSRQELEHRATAMLAGRACDEILSRGATSGAASDLQKATAVVLDIHVRLGLGETLIARESAEFSHLLLDAALRATVNDDLRRLLDDARDHVRRLEGPIRTLAALLVQNRVITVDDIAAVVGPRSFLERARPTSREIAP